MYPGISDTVIKYDKEKNLIIAFYISGVEFTQKQLTQYLLEHLPSYMVPKVYQKIDALPTLPNGKLNLDQLEFVWDNSDSTEVKHIYSELQDAAFNIIKKHLTVQHLDAKDNFFMAGGDSLNGLKIVSELNALLHLNVSITDILLSQSIDGFIKKIQNNSFVKSNFDNTDYGMDTNDNYAPLSFAQEGVWFDCISNNSNRFVVPAYINITGTVDMKKLEIALEKTVEKYSLVKAAIMTDDEFNPYQIIQTDREVKFYQINLEGLNETEIEQELAKVEENILLTTMDIENDLLCKFIIINMDQNKYRLYLLFHHIITDDMSIKIFLRDMFGNYFNHIHNESKNVTQIYFNHCRKEKRYAFSKEDEIYFQELVEKSNYLKLPNSKDRTKSSLEGNYIRFEVDDKKMEKFQKVCASFNASLNIGFLAVYALMLYKITGNCNITLGTPFSSRDEEEVDLIGLLVNLELVCVYIDDNNGFGDVIKQIKEIVMNYIGEKYPPYVDLCRIFKASRDKMMIPHHIVYNYLEDEDLVNCDDVVVSPIIYINSQVSHNFGLMINHSKNGTYGEFTYNINYIDYETAEYAKDTYLNFLNLLLGNEHNEIEKGWN
jgi:hypothetical protein